MKNNHLNRGRLIINDSDDDPRLRHPDHFYDDPGRITYPDHRATLPWISFILLVFLVAHSLSAQRVNEFPARTLQRYVHSLEDCWAIALEQAPEKAFSDLAVKSARADLLAAEREKKPIIRAQSQLGYQFGRSIDPTTNAFVDQAILFNSSGITGEWSLYGGGRLRASISQEQGNYRAAQHEAEVAKQDLRFDVLFAFRNALEASAVFDLRRQLLRHHQDRLREIRILISGGIRPKNDLLEFELGVASSRQDSALAHFQLVRSERELAAVMGYPSDTRVTPHLENDLGESLPPTALLLAPGSDPALLALAARQRAAQAALRVIAAANRPSVHLFGRIGSNYSAAARELVGFEEITHTQAVRLNGERSTLATSHQLPRYAEKPLLRQLEDNFNQVVGVRLDIPLYDGGRTQSRRERAQLDLLRWQREYREARRMREREIDQAFLAHQEAMATTQLTEESWELAVTARDQALEAFRAGGLSITELRQAEREVETAALRRLQARYAQYFTARSITLYNQPE